MIICIVGPTGVGKSKLALRLAKKINGEIVNGDAFQIYKEMDIGTAKPTVEERKLVPHHLFDYVEPTYSFSVYDYQQTLRNKIKELEEKDVPIIVCGGTGLYLKASFYDFNLNKQESSIDMSEYEKMSNEELYEVLKKVDLEETKVIHMNNRKRVLRAIQIYLETGKPKSEQVAEQEHKPIYDVTFIGLTKERDELYSLINKRVDIMFEMGLLEEVKGLMDKYPHSLRSFQAIGYKEIIDGLDNGKDIEEIKELIKKNSRNYAKRQYTYFNHQLEVNWFDDINKAEEFVINKLNAKE